MDREVRMKLPRLLLFPLALVALALAVGCGGDKKDAASDSLDLSKTTSRLEELKSFRFDMTMKLDLGSTSPSGASSSDELGGALASLLLGSFGDIRLEGAFVSPDRAEVAMRFGGQEIGFVQIGRQGWVKFLGDWQAADSSDNLSFGAAPTDLFQGLLPPEVIKGARTTKETVNDQKTVRYAFDKKSLEKVAREMGEGTVDFKELSKADLSVWLTQEQVPVKISMNLAGKNDDGKDVAMKLEMNVKEINKNIQIKAPI
jgi:hypothetical protein